MKTSGNFNPYTKQIYFHNPKTHKFLSDTVVVTKGLSQRYKDHLVLT